MTTYQAPIRDMRFVLHELLHAEQQFAVLDGYADATADTIDMVLEEAAKLCENVLFPLNGTGDSEGCKFADGNVTTPAGFKDAYQQLSVGGWTGLCSAPEYGGQGMPHLLGLCLDEMLASSNMALSLYPGLSRGAYLALFAHGSDELKARYLPHIVSGKWSAVMCLTEAQCGTDLGLLRTRAVPNGDGSYAVSGTKIFITGGEQDLTENIVHMVLARLPDAPPGVKGISMLVVPKFLPAQANGLGARNSLSCGSIEHKMGIKGASTCVMNYDGATGFLLGEPHKGLRNMFTMMNHERLMVGQEGLAQAEVAYQSAVAYARDRVQGRSPTGAKFPDEKADPIIVHPDIRRMLMTARALNEGGRALLAWVGLRVDIAERHPDPEQRERAGDLLALMIPVIKASLTDFGNETCNSCMQVFGGHGYIRESGMEQLVRDSRIAQIYEGANGIQALDLAARKLFMHDGRPIRRLVEEIQTFVESHRDNAELSEFTVPLEAGLGRLQRAADWIREAGDPNDIGAASTDFLRLMALVSMAYMWGRMVVTALPEVDGDNTGFYASKVATARYFSQRVLPQTESLLATLMSGSDSLMALEAEAF